MDFKYKTKKEIKNIKKNFQSVSEIPIITVVDEVHGVVGEDELTED